MAALAVAMLNWQEVEPHAHSLREHGTPYLKFDSPLARSASEGG